VDDHALKIGRQDGHDLHGSFDVVFEQLLDAVLAQQASEAADLGGVARQTRFVRVNVAEKLPLHVLGPTFDKFLVAAVVADIELQQANHQADKKSRRSSYQSRLK
jgi:hypothetical protein